MPGTLVRSAALALAFALPSQALAAGGAPDFVAELTLLLTASAAVAYLFFRLGVTPIVGFLVAGVLIGPNALGLVRDPDLIEAAAEVGVILLLFTIGIEFSLDKLARIRRLIFLGGGFQVAAIVGVVTLLLAAAGVELRSAVFTGCLIALSSTAIVMKLLSDRSETNSPAGQVGLGILIFQDLAVVLMVLLIPVLGGQGSGTGGILWALVKAGAIVAAVIVLAGRVMPRILEAVARTCSQEIFLLTVIGICFGTAYLTSLVGVSLSLGAFLAGLLISESRFGQQAFSEILPLQILFSAAFFLSVGLLLDLGFLVANLPVVVAVIALVVLLKTAATTLSVRLLGFPLALALPSGLLLAQVGEFSFVLERAGRAAGLSPAGLGEPGGQGFVAATVVLMGITPLLAQAGNVLGKRLVKQVKAEEAFGFGEEESEGFARLAGHVLIAGYGPGGKALAGALGASGVPYGIVTLSPTGSGEATAEGRPVLHGDYGRRHILALAGLERASALVIPDDNPGMAHRVLSVAKGLRPDLPVLVGTLSRSSVQELLGAGADLVVSQEQAVAKALVEAVLTRSGLGPKEVAARLAELAAEPTDAPDTPSRREPIVLDALQRSSDKCSHPAATVPVWAPERHVCPECVTRGDTWIHLRICLSCGQVGCCDSSPNQHARRHHEATGHPLIRSLEAGESWAWCYLDEVMLPPQPPRQKEVS